MGDMKEGGLAVLPFVAGYGGNASDHEAACRPLRIDIDTFVGVAVDALGAQVGEAVDDEGADKLRAPGTTLLRPRVCRRRARQGSEALPERQRGDGIGDGYGLSLIVGFGCGCVVVGLARRRGRGERGALERGIEAGWAPRDDGAHRGPAQASEGAHVASRDEFSQEESRRMLKL